MIIRDTLTGMHIEFKTTEPDTYGILKEIAANLNKAFNPIGIVIEETPLPISGGAITEPR